MQHKPAELILSCTAQVLNTTHIYTTIRSVAALKVRCLLGGGIIEEEEEEEEEGYLLFFT